MNSEVKQCEVDGDSDLKFLNCIVGVCDGVDKVKFDLIVFLLANQ